MNAQQEAKLAIEQLRGLRKLRDRGMHVRRSEEKLLNRLSDEALPIVAAELARLDSNATQTATAKVNVNADHETR
jgi:hypothetical protein